MKEAPRLLIVDDEPDICENLADILCEEGYQVDVAHDGESALKLVESNAYDVALLDLKMPGMDGLELHRRIKEISSGTVAIVITAYASSDMARQILASGALQILSKPIDIPKLLNLVNEAVGQPLLLVVDDDEDLCETLWEIFHDKGYRVCTAHDLRQAEAQLQVHNYDVILVDMKLPQGSGLAILDMIRERNPSAESIVITGFRDELNEQVRQALASGARGVCYKPFDVPQLLNKVAELAKS
jgi:DNA-binding NtrC family response regulator